MPAPGASRANAPFDLYNRFGRPGAYRPRPVGAPHHGINQALPEPADMMAQVMRGMWGDMETGDSQDLERMLHLMATQMEDRYS